MTGRIYTPEEKLSRFEDIREIRNLMGRLSSDYVLKKDAEIPQLHWAKRDDVCLGINEGWFIGKSEVARYYSREGERIALESSLIQKAFPEELGDKSAEEVYGVGMMNYKPVDTAVIEVAGDGCTAKGIWSIRGSHSLLSEGGPISYWEWGWFAVDFVREDGQWKIWHMLYLQDVCRPCGHPWTGPEKKYAELEQFAEMKDWAAAAPTIPVVLRERYHAERAFAPTPRLPEPYETFAETFSYGYEEV